MKYKKLFIETIPIVAGIPVSYFFWQNTLVLSLIYLAASLLLIYLHKDRTEFMIFLYGALIGSIVEVIGVNISGYQSFSKPDILGIPIWLPIVWGYGFVAIKRIGSAIKNLTET